MIATTKAVGFLRMKRHLYSVRIFYPIHFVVLRNGLPYTVGFHSLQKTSRSINVVERRGQFERPSTFLTKRFAGTDTSETNEYDDFYHDFDPSAFDQYNKEQGYATFAKGGEQSSSHDYRRDLQSDDSNVDEDTINEMLAERLMMKKTGRYDEADRIRDELLDKHGVLIRDKDRTWRSGGSRSGSGQKWLKSNVVRNKKDFGPKGHDYDLADDAGENNSPFSEEEINQLIAERLSYKLTKNYKSADEIQTKLIAAGVFVDDRSRKWRADGRSFIGFVPSEFKQSKYSQEATKDAVEDIESLVADRALHKVKRMFREADIIRDELLEKYNVVVNDKLLEWSIGGDFGGESDLRKRKVRPYTLSRDSATIPDDLDEIEDLIDQRDAARRNRDFEEADEIMKQLRDKNVFVNDKIRKWGIGEGSGGSATERKGEFIPRTYTKRGGGDLSEERTHQIQNLLAERDLMKYKKEYEAADAIRERLEEEFEIKFNDRASEFSLINGGYIMAQSSSEMDEETKNLIQQKIEDRVRARNDRDYESADSIRDELAANWGVFIDDRVSEWYVEKGNSS